MNKFILTICIFSILFVKLQAEEYYSISLSNTLFVDGFRNYKNGSIDIKAKITNIEISKYKDKSFENNALEFSRQIISDTEYKNSEYEYNGVYFNTKIMIKKLYYKEKIKPYAEVAIGYLHNSKVAGIFSTYLGLATNIKIYKSLDLNLKYRLYSNSGKHDDFYYGLLYGLNYTF